MVKDDNQNLIDFTKLNKPPQGSANLMAITATYCFLKLDNLGKVEAFIN